MSRCVSGCGGSGGLRRVRVFSQLLGGRSCKARVNGNWELMNVEWNWEFDLRELTATSAQSVGFIMTLAKRRGTLRYSMKEKVS